MNLEWKVVSSSGGDYYEASFRVRRHITADVQITIEPRPHYCDRGNWVVKIFDHGALSIDDADMFPRYYFDLEVAKSEMKALLTKRGVLV